MNEQLEKKRLQAIAYLTARKLGILVRASYVPSHKTDIALTINRARTKPIRRVA